MGTYNYQLAKFLGKLLDDFIPSDHFTKDTFSFVEEIKTESITRFFYHVTSLFTNIPLEETIHLTIDFLFQAKLDLVEKVYTNPFSLPQVKPIFTLIETCMTKLMGLQWPRL